MDEELIDGIREIVERREKLERPELVLEGILMAIPEIRPQMRIVHNGVYGPGSQGWKMQVGVETVIEIMSKTLFGEGPKRIVYKGVILPDSIGHRVQVYKRGERISIEDIDCQRSYL